MIQLGTIRLITAREQFFNLVKNKHIRNNKTNKFKNKNKVKEI